MPWSDPNAHPRRAGSRRPYVLSHGEFRDEIQSLLNEIIEAFPTDQAVPEARAAFERDRRELCDGLRHLPVID